MNTHITPNAQPLYTFQNRSGAFVDVLALLSTKANNSTLPP